MIKKVRSIRTWIASILLLGLVANYAFASIVVRAVVVNPSKFATRKVPFKSYLPKEIKPSNIVDMGDLELAYDPREGAYYVFKEFILEPKEVATIEIEMEDVWRIPQEQIDHLKSEVDEIMAKLVFTEYADRANYLKNTIQSNLNQIERSQNTVNPSPGGYISDYRENLKTVAQVRADIDDARKLLEETEKIKPMLTWKLIIGIVGFLGILGVVFFFVWQRQIKSLADITEEISGIDDVSPIKEVKSGGEKRQAQEEKKADMGDIQKRLQE